MAFEPDYRYVLAAAQNHRPARLPMYEHIIGADFMEQATGTTFASLLGGDEADRAEFFRRYNGFWLEHEYDTVSFEVCVTEMLPGGGALVGERAGPIQSRADVEAYPWDDLPRMFWDIAGPRIDAFVEALPPGMKGVGGIGNGPFEISEDLVGFQELCYLQADDPDLFAELYVRIGDLLMALWSELLPRYGDAFAVCRIGDDMGFKTGTLLQPHTLLDHVVPQYRRVIGQIHDAGKPFLLHSCGRIFEIMPALIDAGIDAKHSNEDVIAPYQEWIDRYSSRIGLFGGVDTDRLCQMDPADLYDYVLDKAAAYRDSAHGFALGSGNSVPGYVPVEGFRAMNRAARDLRAREA